MRIFGTTLGTTRSTGVGILALLAAFALACSGGGGGGNSGSSGDVADTGVGDFLDSSQDGSDDSGSSDTESGPDGPPAIDDPETIPDPTTGFGGDFVVPSLPDNIGIIGEPPVLDPEFPSTLPWWILDQATGDPHTESETVDDTDYVVVQPDNDGGLDLDSSNPDTVATETSPPTLTLINDLYTDQRNGIVWVRIGSYQPGAECNSLNDPNTERLNLRDSVYDIADTNVIQAGYTTPNVLHSEDFDVSGFAGGNYCVFIQTGWWELFNPTLGSPYFDPEAAYWTIHPLVVAGCDGQNPAYKSRIFKVNSHTAGTFEVKASDWLPHGDWYGSGLCP